MPSFAIPGSCEHIPDVKETRQGAGPANATVVREMTLLCRKKLPVGKKGPVYGRGSCLSGNGFMVLEHAIYLASVLLDKSESVEQFGKGGME
jgi:hypothetical protein